MERQQGDRREGEVGSKGAGTWRPGRRPCWWADRRRRVSEGGPGTPAEHVWGWREEGRPAMAPVPGQV